MEASPSTLLLRSRGSDHSPLVSQGRCSSRGWLELRSVGRCERPHDGNHTTLSPDLHHHAERMVLRRWLPGGHHNRRSHSFRYCAQRAGSPRRLETVWGGRCSPLCGASPWRMHPGAHLEWSRAPPGCLPGEVSLAPCRWLRAPHCRKERTRLCSVIRWLLSPREYRSVPHPNLERMRECEGGGSRWASERCRDGLGLVAPFMAGMQLAVELVEYGGKGLPVVSHDHARCDACAPPEPPAPRAGPLS